MIITVLINILIDSGLIHIMMIITHVWSNTESRSIVVQRSDLIGQLLPGIGLLLSLHKRTPCHYLLLN